jgi:hypothetical protein
MLNLENLGVSEMSIQEQRETEGGIFWFGAIICAICLAVAIYELVTE